MALVATDLVTTVTEAKPQNPTTISSFFGPIPIEISANSGAG
jgi:hypothetical protein